MRFSIYITQVTPLENGNHEDCMGHPLSLGRTRNVHNTLFQLLYVDVQLTYRVLQLSNYFKVAGGRGGAQNTEIYNTIFARLFSLRFRGVGSKFRKQNFRRLFSHRFRIFCGSCF